MFHQANLVPTPTPVGEKSLLEYWYEVVLERMARYLNLQGDESFPLKVGDGEALSIAPNYIACDISTIDSPAFAASGTSLAGRLGMAVFEPDQPNPDPAPNQPRPTVGSAVG